MTETYRSPSAFNDFTTLCFNFAFIFVITLVIDYIIESGYFEREIHNSNSYYDEDQYLKLEKNKASIISNLSKEHLVIQNLSKEYTSFFQKNSVMALDSMYLLLGKGESIAILGENGAGKTTFLGILTCRLKKSSGYASLFGVSISDKQSIREMLGVCP